MYMLTESVLVNFFRDFWLRRTFKEWIFAEITGHRPRQLAYEIKLMLWMAWLKTALNRCRFFSPHVREMYIQLPFIFAHFIDIHRVPLLLGDNFGKRCPILIILYFAFSDQLRKRLEMTIKIKYWKLYRHTGFLPVLQGECLSVCLSVRLSHSVILSKRRKIGSRNFHCRLPERLVSGSVKIFPKFESGYPDRGR